MTSKARELRRRMSIDPDAPQPSETPRRPARPTVVGRESTPHGGDSVARTPEPPETTAPPSGPVPAAERPQAGEPAPETDPPAGAGPAPDEEIAPPAPGAEPVTDSETTPEARIGGGTPTIASPSSSSTPPPPTPSAPPEPRSSTGGSRAGSREPASSPDRAPRSRKPARPGSGARSSKPGDDWTSALDDPAIEDGRHGYRSFYVDDTVFARFRAAVYWTARRHDATGVPDNMSVGVEAYMDEIATDLERRYNDGAVFRPTPDQVRAHRKRRDAAP